MVMATTKPAMIRSFLSRYRPLAMWLSVRYLSGIIFIVLCCYSGYSYAWYPRLLSASIIDPPLAGTLVGSNRDYYIGRADTLMEIARRGQLGYQNLVAANPGVDAWQPPTGARLVLPYATLLPTGLAQPGVTINLAEFRLYLVWRDGEQLRVRIYPIGLGRDGWLTPEGEYKIANMIENPVWTMPATLREENPELPAVIPPGPDNPLGSHWIGLSQPGYGIHGTNRPYGIGRQVSHGCIRLYPSGIQDLVNRVARGMTVKVIYQPIKLGRQGETLYLEAHRDYLERLPDALAKVRRQAQVLGWQRPLLDEIIAPHVTLSRGVPQPLVIREAGNSR